MLSVPDFIAENLEGKSGKTSYEGLGTRLGKMWVESTCWTVLLWQQM